MFWPIFFIICFLPFSPLSSIAFCTISCISYIFNIFFQEFYPSPSVSDRFYTISSGCYHIFLHFHCIFPVAPVTSMFQQILHPLFWLLSYFPARLLSHFLHCIFPVFSSVFCIISFDCYHNFLFSCSFYILGFQSIHTFLIYFSKIFTRLLFTPFPLVCCIFNVCFQEFYPFP